MKILVMPDKFKGTLSAREVCEIVREAIVDILPDAEVTLLPLADGGEGTLEALREENDTVVAINVYGPLFEPTEAKYLIRNDTAIVEMGESAGLMKIPTAARNPEKTSSYGFGQLIRDAYVHHDIRKFLLGIGGSATNDCGTGMLAALGVHFFDKHGREVAPVGRSLGKIADMKYDDSFAGITECSFTVLSDVSNPLLGKHGAARVYAPQKGADAAMVERLEAGSRNFVDVIQRTSNSYVGDIAGGGAAGGVGMALKHFLGASMQSGAAYVLTTKCADKKVRRADIVITGEGCVDMQTMHGKLVSEVVSLAKYRGKRCYIVCGKAEDGIDAGKLGVDGLFSIEGSGVGNDEAVRDAKDLLYALIKREFGKILQ